jgi:rhodanese-related sulfurtransferase
MRNISLPEFKNIYLDNDDLMVVDVRSPAEFDAQYLSGSHNIPLDGIDHSAVDAFLRGKGRGDDLEIIYLMCKSGHRSKLAQDKLKSMNHKVICIEGGVDALSRDGDFDVRKNQSVPMSLERQVRIAAGSLVLLGMIVGTLIHPAAYALSAFVGGGLVFAGVTDWCGMGLLLAKMPWNK